MRYFMLVADKGKAGQVPKSLAGRGNSKSQAPNPFDRLRTGPNNIKC